MNITRHTGAAGEVRLALAGELDLATVDRLHQHVKQEIIADPPPRRLVIDLTGVTFCDSTGLGALLKAQAVATENGTTFLVINPSGMTRRLMQATGLHDVLTSAPS
ncbi:STAS domain-containing protein [Krasilnikovia sp. M28-CT-15]|uniref:STAS domain-containing protein n=1 Tax=Krasilnikovia sp. M28-CT-15 TaxID=3373540 RepID=UPI003876494D